MGILEGMVAGAGEALQNVGLQGVAAAIQAERDARLSEIRLSEEATIRQRGKDDAAAERGRVADYSKPIMGQATPAATVTADAAGLNDASSVGADENVGVNVQKISRAPTAREAQQRASAAGDLKSAEVFGKDADRQEDNLRGDAKQKSDDAKWKATHEETVRFHTATLRHQAAQLGLKAQEAKDFERAADSYITNKAEYDALVAANVVDKDVMATAKQDVDRAALKLKQYRVDVGDTSDFAKRLNLSATLTSLNKTIEDINADPATVAKAKAARDSVIEQMAALTSVKGTDETGGKPGDKYTVGQVVNVPGKGNMEYLGNNKWKAAKPAAIAPSGDSTPAEGKSEKPAARGPFPDVKVKEGGLIDTAAKYYGSDDPQRAYLQGKIDRKEELTPSEKVRAQRLKLL